MTTTNKKYFCDGKEISFEDMQEINANNNRLMESNDPSDWLNIKFIYVVNVDEIEDWIKAGILERV